MDPHLGHDWPRPPPREITIANVADVIRLHGHQLTEADLELLGNLVACYQTHAVNMDSDDQLAFEIMLTSFGWCANRQNVPSSHKLMRRIFPPRVPQGFEGVLCHRRMVTLANYAALVLSYGPRGTKKLCKAASLAGLAIPAPDLDAYKKWHRTDLEEVRLPKPQDCRANCRAKIVFSDEVLGAEDGGNSASPGSHTSENSGSLNLVNDNLDAIGSEEQAESRVNSLTEAAFIKQLRQQKSSLTKELADSRSRVQHLESALAACGHALPTALDQGMQYF